MGAFLRSRRNRLSPADLGPQPGTGRRVTGLRREEAAALAHVERVVRANVGGSGETGRNDGKPRANNGDRTVGSPCPSLVRSTTLENKEVGTVSYADHMQLKGKITSDRPLLVLAVEEEAQYLDTRLPVLLTGMGKVNAATALASVLGRGPLPSEVVNLGTAGALRPGWHGTHVIGSVMQHDLDSDTLRTLTGETYGAPLTIGDPDGPVLATGDSFISDEADRLRLAEHAPLVDMEGYAVATAARLAGVGVSMVKHVSDDADETAAKTWREAVGECAKALAHWAEHNIPTYA
ncbi:nucleoside phosphorylase [Streptomyces tendae]